ILRIPQLGDVASFASDKPNKAKPPHIRQNLPPSGGTCEQSEQILPNVRDIRSFSGTKWKKNLGEARAEG
ncbi:MAG: hypothetical protein ABIJ40_17935, partial [Bacteroidota bacterium]